MVDFLTCVRTAEKYGILTYGPVSQGSFLNKLGISLRAATLLKNATPQQAINIAASKNRLVSDHVMDFWIIDSPKMYVLAHIVLLCNVVSTDNIVEYI